EAASHECQLRAPRTPRSSAARPAAARIRASAVSQQQVLGTASPPVLSPAARSSRTDVGSCRLLLRSCCAPAFFAAFATSIVDGKKSPSALFRTPASLPAAKGATFAACASDRLAEVDADALLGSNQ